MNGVSNSPALPNPPPSSPPPDFSDGELARRRAALLACAERHGLDAVVGYGANRSGSAVPWLTGWPVTREAAVVLTAAGPVILLVGFANHVPNARRIARDAEVRWIGDRPVDTLAGLLPGRGRGLGVVGPLPARLETGLRAYADPVVALDTEYVRLRQVKSAEEIEWIRYAAALTDASARALVAAAVPGSTEFDLVAAAESAYAGTGATNHVHYVAVTSMVAPDRCVPGQWPTDRRIESGSVVTFELSTSWGPDYPGQLLRTVTVDAEPTPLYRELHAVAEAALAAMVRLLKPGTSPADILQAARVIPDAGFRTVDDLVHGLGGGYLPPVLRQRVPGPTGLDAEPLRPAMTIVVQPNVCTPDERAGVQTGELFQITDDGAVSLHRFPAGLLRGGVGQ
jgi:Xaa-Pro aminopeptidase